MPSLFSPATSAALMRITGGVAVVKGSQTTYGTEKWAPITILRGENGSGGILTADGAVVVATGALSGITAEDGIGDAVTVDGVACTVIGIVAPPEAGFPGGEFDGDMIALVLRRA